MKDFPLDRIMTQERFKRSLEKHVKKATSTSVLVLFTAGLTGCGSDNEDEQVGAVTGTVFDGPLSLAKVFIDANNNGLLDASEDWTLTNSDGSYSLSTTQTGTLGVVSTSETIDTSSGAAVSGLSLFAPAGSNVISPATTVVKALVDKYVAANPDATAEALATAQTAAYDDTLEALGLSPDLDLTSYNPFSAAVDSLSADAVAYVQKAAQIVAVANTIAETESAAGGADKADVLASAITEIANQIAAASAADTTITIDGTFVDTIIAAAAPTMDADTTLKSDIAGAIVNVSDSLEAMTDVTASGDLFYAAQALLVEAAVEQAVTGASDTLSVLKDATVDLGALSGTLVQITGSTRGKITEDDTPDATTGDISVTGTLKLKDPDTTDDITYKFDTANVSSIGTNLGSLTITDAGVWTYTLDSANVADLNTLQSVDAKGIINGTLAATDPGYKSQDSFGRQETFKVNVLDADGEAVNLVAGKPLTKLITVNIDGANDAVILNASATTIADVSYTQGDAITSITVTDQFTDPDAAEKLTYSATGLPAGVSINAKTGEITGSPSSSIVGAFDISVAATDTGGKKATAASFKMTVTNVNDSPELVSTDAVSKETAEDAVFSYDSSVLFTDPDIANSHDENDVLTYTVSGNPAWLSIDSTTGVITGTPANADVTSTSISITATDAYGLSVSKDVTLEVTNTNDAVILNTSATAIADVSYTQGDSISSITVTDQFTDVDAVETITYSSTGVPFGVTINAETGEITGTLDSSVVGAYDVFITATDTGGATATTAGFKMTVANKNDSPELVSTDAVSKETAEDAVFSYDSSVLFTDPDIANSHDENDTLIYTVSGNPSWLSINSTTGVITGTPANADVTSTTISITATDAYSLSVSKDVTLEVTNTNDAPVASAKDLGILKDTVAKSYSGTDFTSSVEDVDANDTYTLTAFTQTSGTSGTTVDGGDGSFTFTPVNGENNDSVTFSYTVTDAAGSSSTSTATLQVVDAIPVGTGAEDDGAITLASAAHDGATFTIDSSEEPTVQAMYNSSTGVFTPAANFNGTVAFNILPSGEIDTIPGILVVSAVNDLPVISETSATTLSVTEDIDASGTVSFDDIDGGNLTYTYSTPSKGTVTDTEQDGAYKYSPTANANGADSFTVSVTDGTDVVTQNISVTITAVADAPIGSTTATLDVTEDTPKTGSVVASDGDGDTLTYTSSTPSKGTIAFGADGVFSYDPTANENGSDSFTVTVTDNDANTADLTQTVAVTIAAVNDEPIVVGTGIPDANSTSSFTLGSNLSTYFDDLDGEDLIYSVETGAGTATVSSGNLSISGLTPGATTVTVTATDGASKSVSDTFDLTVLGDLITSTVSTSGNTHTVDFTLNMNGVQSSTMTSIDGFDFAITAIGSPDSSTGIDKTGLNYASFNNDSDNRTAISDDYSVSLYQTTTNFRSDNFNTDSSWTLVGGDAVALATEEIAYNIALDGAVYDIASYLGETFKIGTLTLTTQSDLTDLDLVVNGSIIGSFGTNETTSVADEILTAVTIDII